MPKVLTDVQFLVGALEMAPFTGEFDVAETADTRQFLNFACQGFDVVLPSRYMAEASIAGHADYATGAVSATYNASTARGLQVAYSILPDGTSSAVGSYATLQRGLIMKMTEVSGAVGEPADFAMALRSDDAALDGYVAAPLASRTTSGYTGTGINVTGPTASQRLYAALHVTAASGTNLVVKVQSDDNSGFTSATDRITFSTVSATGWQWSSVAGDLSTETYWRAIATIASGTFSFAVTLGVI